MKVRIYKPTKTAMQSGQAKTKDWVLEYESLSKRQAEPLMGWTSSEDTLNQVQMRFTSKDQAIEFAQEKGWDFTVSEERHKKVKPRNYVDNFVYRGPETKKKKS